MLARSGTGLRQQVDEVEYTGDVRRTLSSRGSMAVLVVLFPTLGDGRRRRWHYVLVELHQQSSNPVQQRAAAQECGGLIGEYGVRRTGEERRQRCSQRRL